VRQTEDALQDDGITYSMRTPLIVVGLALIAGAIWFATSWIDMGDGTCGSALQPAVWDNMSECESVMPLRRALAFATVVAGVLLVLWGTRGRKPGRGLLAATLAGCAIVALTVLLLFNEFVRSDGLWNH